MNRRGAGGSWALVTGASRGLGRAFAEACALRGYNLALVSLPGEGLEATAADLGRRHGVECRAWEADLATEAGRRRVIEGARQELPGLQLLVNNAGIGRNGGFGEEGADFHRSVVEVNVQATLALTHALIPLLARSAPSRIITVASLAAFQPMPLFATYAASKAFLASWGLALAEELGDLGVGSTVLAPGGIYTSEEIRANVRAQGLGGYLSTLEPEKVADIALRAAERGRGLVIPGAFNRLLFLLGALVPGRLKARAVHSRWLRVLGQLRADRGLAAAGRGTSRG